MLMGHPPPIIACGREKAPQSYFKGLTPVQVPMVMEELIACNSQVQEALADTPEVVQEITQAGPNPFEGVSELLIAPLFERRDRRLSSSSMGLRVRYPTATRSTPVKHLPLLKVREEGPNQTIGELFCTLLRATMRQGLRNSPPLE